MYSRKWWYTLLLTIFPRRELYFYDILLLSFKLKIRPNKYFILDLSFLYVHSPSLSAWKIRSALWMSWLQRKTSLSTMIWTQFTCTFSKYTFFRVIFYHVLPCKNGKVTGKTIFVLVNDLSAFVCWHYHFMLALSSQNRCIFTFFSILSEFWTKVDAVWAVFSYSQLCSVLK